MTKLRHCSGCGGWVNYGTHSEGYACPGLAARATPEPAPHFDHDGMYRHHHHYETQEPIWWENAEQFGGEKREHRHWHRVTPEPARDLRVPDDIAERVNRFETGRNGEDDTLYRAATDRTILVGVINRLNALRAAATPEPALDGWREAANTVVMLYEDAGEALLGDDPGPALARLDAAITDLSVASIRTLGGGMHSRGSSDDPPDTWTPRATPQPALDDVTAFLDKYGLANTSGERHLRRREALERARAALTLADTDR